MQDLVLPQGCGGGVAPTSSSLSPSSSLPSFLSLLKTLTQVCHFFENFGDFSPVENFFELSTSYQHYTFFDAVLGKFSGEATVFRRFCLILLKMHNTLKKKEIILKGGEINSATAASLRNFRAKVVEKLSTTWAFLGEV